MDAVPGGVYLCIHAVLCLATRLARGSRNQVARVVIVFCRYCPVETMAEPALKRRRHVEADASCDLEKELTVAVGAGARPAIDPLPNCIATLKETLTEIIGADKWGGLFDASLPCVERCKALDVVLDMPAAYEVLGSDLAAMKQHVYALTEKLLLAHVTGKGFTFDDAIRHHDKYSVRAMCATVAATRYTHLGSALSVDPLCARTPYTAVSMYLLPHPCRLGDKVVYERPMPIGGSNTRKSKLHDRARALFTQSLKAKLLKKGLLFKWVPYRRSASTQPSSQKRETGVGKAGKCGKKGPSGKVAAGGPKGAGGSVPPVVPELPSGGKGGVKGGSQNAHDIAQPGDDTDASKALEITKVIGVDHDSAWLFTNARVTFEGLIDHANEQAVSLEHCLGPRIFYASEEGSLTMALPGQSAKAGALTFEEFILFSDGTAAKVAAGCKRFMNDANIGGLVMLQPTQIPAVFGQLSGRNPTKRWRICLNNDALTTKTEDIESRIGADCAVCLASEGEGLQHQLDNFFPDVNLVEGVIRVVPNEHDRIQQFVLEETGRKVLLSFWEQVCKACNVCRGRDDARMRDHFTDSLGIFQCRVVKVYVETVNDMNVILPQGLRRVCCFYVFPQHILPVAARFSGVGVVEIRFPRRIACAPDSFTTPTQFSTEYLASFVSCGEITCATKIGRFSKNGSSVKNVFFKTMDHSQLVTVFATKR